MKGWSIDRPRTGGYSPVSEFEYHDGGFAFAASLLGGALLVWDATGTQRHVVDGAQRG